MTESASPAAGSVAFDRCTTEEVLRTACAQAGLPCGEAELLRLGENAIYRIADPGVVVRIARTMKYCEDAKKEVAVSAWLSTHGFPAARILDLPQPVAVKGYPVTFWYQIEGRAGGRTNIQELGRLLRRLHDLSAPTEFALPVERVLGRVRGRVEPAPVPDADKYFLLRRCEDLDQELGTLEFPLPPSPTHGDAHIKNLMVYDGRPVLIDFERFSWGQPEWDLALTATEHKTAGWWTGREYRMFADGYGCDVTAWAGFDVLRSVHEIKLTTWLMQNVRESPEIADEYRLRMRTVRGGEREHTWHAF